MLDPQLHSASIFTRDLAGIEGIADESIDNFQKIMTQQKFSDANVASDESVTRHPFGDETGPIGRAIKLN